MFNLSRSTYLKFSSSLEYKQNIWQAKLISCLRKWVLFGESYCTSYTFPYGVSSGLLHHDWRGPAIYVLSAHRRNESFVVLQSYWVENGSQFIQQKSLISVTHVYSGMFRLSFECKCVWSCHQAFPPEDRIRFQWVTAEIQILQKSTTAPISISLSFFYFSSTCTVAKKVKRILIRNIVTNQTFSPNSGSSQHSFTQTSVCKICMIKWLWQELAKLWRKFDLKMSIIIHTQVFYLNVNTKIYRNGSAVLSLEEYRWFTNITN